VSTLCQELPLRLGFGFCDPEGVFVSSVSVSSPSSWVVFSPRWGVRVFVSKCQKKKNKKKIVCVKKKLCVSTKKTCMSTVKSTKNNKKHRLRQKLSQISTCFLLRLVAKPCRRNDIWRNLLRETECIRLGRQEWIVNRKPLRRKQLHVQACPQTKP